MNTSYLNFDKSKFRQNTWGDDNTSVVFDCVLKNENKVGTYIEMRRQYRGACNILIFVALDGWNNDKFNERMDGEIPKRYTKDVSGLNVRISMNGPLMITFGMFAEIYVALMEAKIYLEKL